MRLMALRHVLLHGRVTVGGRAARMRGHALAGMKDFDRCRREARLQLLAGQLIGNAVIMTIDLDVIIDRGAHRFPLRHGVTRGRQSLQGRPIEDFKQGCARALTLAERTVIQPLEQGAVRDTRAGASA